MTSTQVTFPPTNQILATLSAQQLHQFDGNLQSLPLNAGLLLYEAEVCLFSRFRHGL